MNINKAITYSVLAHIRNTGTLIKGPIDIFVPLVKRVLYLLNQEGIHEGDNISLIKQRFDIVYQIDIPLPVIKGILKEIANEVNKESSQNFILYQNDNSFSIKNYVFEEFEDIVQKSKSEAEQVQKLFIQFCEINSYSVENELSIFEFIDKSKLSLSKYLSGNKIRNSREFTVEAQFVEYFKKIPTAYELIRKIYLGSILSSYIAYKTDSGNKGCELLLDTNFLISLLDLNTQESTHTCEKLLEVGLSQGYKFSVLLDTIEETQMLLRKKADNLDNTFLQAKVNKEDIYNACERRKLNRNDLERIADNLEMTLNKLSIICIPVTTKYNNLAKHSEEYKNLSKVRNSNKSALHDATAIYYVREKRNNKKIYDFEKVSCWFVNNSNSPENEPKRDNEGSMNGSQTEVIKADELLNILWLSNPAVTKNVTKNDIADIGLSSLVAFTLNEALPKASIIKELDDNIQKYAKEDITDKDILLISTRITNRQLKNIQELNDIAKKDKDKFVAKLKEEAHKQNILEIERQKKLDEVLSEINHISQKLQEATDDLQLEKEQLNKGDKDRELSVLELRKEIEEKLEKERKDNSDYRAKIKEEKKEDFYKNELKKWRRNSWIILSICIIVLILSLIYVFHTSEWNFEKAVKMYKDNFLISIFLGLLNLAISGYAITSLVLKYHNYSNIEAYKRSLKLPDELR